jgi:hypothetical protein
MLVIKKELGFYDFQKEFEEVLNGYDWEAQQIIFDNLECMFDDGVDEMTVNDYLRFQLQVMTQNEVLESYNIIDDEDIENMTEDEKTEAIDLYLSDNTFLMGYYKDSDDDIVFLFDEF